MCLGVRIEMVGGDGAVLRNVADSMPAQFLPFKYEARSRLRRRPSARLTLDMDGCELLADTADWDAATWDMSPDAADRLAQTLAWLMEEVRQPIAVQALWEGEKPEREVATTPTELTTLARQSRLGTKTRYLVRPITSDGR